MTAEQTKLGGCVFEARGTARLPNFHIAAKVNLNAHAGKHGSFSGKRLVGAFRVWRISDLDMVGLVARHHLIARDAMKHSVHDGPLGRGHLPTSLGLLARQLHHGRAPQVGVQRPIFDEDAAPDDLAWLADAFERAAAEAELTSVAVVRSQHQRSRR